MTEQPLTDQADQADAQEPFESASTPQTGVERVDAVVDDVAGLEDRPVDEHVAVFESSHDELRRTLDDPA